MRLYVMIFFFDKVKRSYAHYVPLIDIYRFWSSSTRIAKMNDEYFWTITRSFPGKYRMELLIRFPKIVHWYAEKHAEPCFTKVTYDYIGKILQGTIIWRFDTSLETYQSEETCSKNICCCIYYKKRSILIFQA